MSIYILIVLAVGYPVSEVVIESLSVFISVGAYSSALTSEEVLRRSITGCLLAEMLIGLLLINVRKERAVRLITGSTDCKLRTGCLTAGVVTGSGIFLNLITYATIFIY